MKNSKGFATIPLIIIIVVIAGAVGYFVLMNKSTPITQQPMPTPATTQIKTSTPKPTPKDETANWKTYSNDRYRYTLKYPNNWYTDTTYSENDFTQRGPLEDNDLIGGDTTWSNYQNLGQYDLGTIPSDFAAVYLLIYKIDSKTTLDGFIDLKHFAYSKKENININGTSGIRLTAKDPENSDIIYKIVLLKAGNTVFDFSYARNSVESAMVMDQMINNFKLK
mgnify:CR=1 FL=1